MRKHLSIGMNLAVVGLIVCGLALIITRVLKAEAKYTPSASVIEMSKDIKRAQEFVRDYEKQVLDMKNKANVYRKAICDTDKQACTAEYLNPLNADVDLSSFLAPAAK